MGPWVEVRNHGYFESKNPHLNTTMLRRIQIRTHDVRTEQLDKSARWNV